MSDRIRILTDAGIERFARYLDELRADKLSPPPNHLLSDHTTSAPYEAEVVIDRKSFTNRFEFGRSLCGALACLDRHKISHNYALWTWLALYYFDLICPASADGSRTPHQNAWYILEKRFNHQRDYKHLVRTAWLSVLNHGDMAKILLLASRPDTISEICDRLTSKQRVFGNRNVIAGAYALYFDTTDQKPKRGTGGKDKGSPRRLMSVTDQLDLTYDLVACTKDQFISLLPKEFDKFRPLSNSATGS